MVDLSSSDEDVAAWSASTAGKAAVKVYPAMQQTAQQTNKKQLKHLRIKAKREEDKKNKIERVAKLAADAANIMTVRGKDLIQVTCKIKGTKTRKWTVQGFALIIRTSMCAGFSQVAAFVFDWLLFVDQTQHSIRMP